MHGCKSSVMAFICLLLLPLTSCEIHEDADKGTSPSINDAQLTNSRQEKVINSVHLFFWTPPIDGHGNGPKGTFLLLHGCGHHARGFYDLPEEAQMSLAVLKRGFVVVAPDAYPAMTTLDSECWNLGHDGPLVRDALKNFIQAHELEAKPVYGLGVSNGGVMLSYLHSMLGVDFAGMHFNVSPGGAAGYSEGMFAIRAQPPVSFVRMVADPVTPPATIKAAVKYFRRSHTPVQVLTATPQPLGSLLKKAKQMQMSPLLVKKVLKALNGGGFAQGRSGRMAGGAFKASSWRRLRRLRRHQPHFYSLYLPIGSSDHAMKCLIEHPELRKLIGPHVPALTEELKVMEGIHSATSQHIGRSLDFLLQHRRARHKRRRARKVPKARKQLRSNL